MKSWPSKLIAATAAFGLCAGVALAQSGGTMTISHQKSPPKILKQAALVGPHAKDSTLKLNFSLKSNHTNKQLAAVEGFLKARGIKVLGVSPNGTVIHTRATTEFYEHALGVRLNDYTLKGQTFISSPDLVKLPASIAPYVNGVFATIPRYTVHGHFSPASVAKMGKSVHAAAPGRVPPVILASNPSPRDSWTTVADLPIPISDNCAATDPLTGLVYDVGGVSNSVTTAAGYVYDSGLDTWSPIADMPVALEKPACAFIGGHLYVTAGWDTLGNNNQTLYIYDPSNDSWSTGASMTVSVGGGPGYAALDGEFYVIAGCADGTTCPGTTGVEVYDPSSNSWSGAADYPEAVAWNGCAGAGTVIVCAGGTTSSTTDTADAYKYDPGSNTWTAVAPVPYDIWAMGAIGTADGHFLISNGVTDGFATLTNLASIYDVGANTWTALPNNPQTTYRLAGACGFYTIGGNPFLGLVNASLLPGYNVCALTGPTGTVSGTVTDTSTGDPIAGAKLSFTPGTRSTTTQSDGTYTITLATGDYTETATAFGYEPDSASVTITDGGTTTQDFALSPSAAATLHGRVLDSGHRYPLVAEVVVKNNGTTVADVWTGVGGAYSVSLPTGGSYDMTVTPYFSGYTPGTATVTLNGDTQKNFVLDPDASCTAPGYGYSFGENFDSGTFPPTGWTVTNDVAGSPTVWMLSSQEPTDNGNYTGGTGDAADADNNDVGSGQGAYDTSLISPPISLADVGDSPSVTFLENFVPLGTSALDVDISTDGGSTWTTIDHQTTQCGAGVYTPPGCTESYDLSSYVSGATSFQLRWRFYNADTSAWDWYAQIDDVQMGSCNPIAGGLVVGKAIDYNAHQNLSGVTVTDESGNTTTTGPVGSQTGYVMFEAAGEHTLTLSKSNYQDATVAVSVSDGEVVPNWTFLHAGQLASRPTQATVSVPVGTQQTFQLGVINKGSAPVDWQLSSIDAPPPGSPALKGRYGNGAPLQTIHGHFSPLSLLKQGKGAMRGGVGAHNPAPHDAPWTDIADYPEAIMDNCSATDDTTGLVYTVAGYNGLANVGDGYVYDPTAQSWSSIAAVPAALEKPACVFINGLLYVADGWDSLGNASASLYIYNPSTDTWTSGADNPAALGGGATAVALNGEMYVIGGCTSACGETTVEVYDPTSNAWSAASDYPIPISWESCGALNGLIYCAGGSAVDETNATYAYDPSNDSWSGPLAPIPVTLGGLWGSGYEADAADGTLLISGGVTDNFATVTNEGFSYDAASDTWTTIANSNNTLYRGGSACGFYKIGGSSGGFTPVASSEELPGFNLCSAGTVPWLSFDPASGTLAANDWIAVDVTVDGTGQTAGTSETVQIRLTGNTPYGAIVIPLTVNWQ